jgi:acylphosphatase
MIKRTIRWHGRVQGVGFRATVRTIADELGLAGHVRNLHDGSVEAVVEGSSQEIDGLIDAVGQRMQGNIDRSETTEASATGAFTGFSVQR